MYIINLCFGPNRLMSNQKYNYVKTQRIVLTVHLMLQI